MKRIPMRVLTAALGCLAVSCALSGPVMAQNPSAADSAPKTPVQAPLTKEEEQKALYDLGVLLSRNLEGFSLTDAEFDAVSHGFADAFHHKADMKEAEQAIPKIQGMQRDRQQKVADVYLAKAAKEPGAKKTASGLIYVAVKEGTGASPKSTDKVKVTYEGRLTDGDVFDSSAQHGGSATFALNGVIPCWTEAVQLMKVGGKARIVCPSAIAYGQRQMGPKIKPGSTLEFDIELLEIEPPTPTPAPPATGAAPHPAPSTPPSHP
jgi:FKBP-type peptidyl-prolyl cis-trans isomerase FkpA